MTTDLKIEYNTVYLDGITNSIITDKTTRIQKANGDWQEITDHYTVDGLVKTGTSRSIAINGVGLYKIDDDNEKLLLISDRPSNFVSEYDSTLENSSEYLGETEILGEKVAIIQWNNGIFVYFAKNLDGVYLKFVDGLQQREAVSIESGTFELMKLPEYTVDTKVRDNLLNLFNELEDEVENEDLLPSCNRRSGCSGGGAVDGYFCLRSTCPCTCGGVEVSQYYYRARCCLSMYGRCSERNGTYNSWNISYCDSEVCNC